MNTPVPSEGLWLEMVSRIVETSTKSVALNSGMTVVDVGVGAGSLTLALAQRAGKVIAIDNELEALRQLSRRMDEQGYSNIECRHSAAERLPLPDGSVDAVYVSMLIHHLLLPRAALLEMQRVVKPGGWLVIAEHDLPVKPCAAVSSSEPMMPAETLKGWLCEFGWLWVRTERVPLCHWRKSACSFCDGYLFLVMGRKA